MKRGFLSLWLGLGILGFVLACGGGFSPRMLTGGAEVIAPASSGLELVFPEDLRMDWRRRVQDLGVRRKATYEADLQDLRAAAPKLDPKMMVRYSKIRLELIEDKAAWVWNKVERMQMMDGWMDTGMLEELPMEFQLYTEGAIAYRKEEVEKARGLWLNVLDLPEGERKYRSVWAAWMLARTAEKDGAMWYKKVEALVDAGFVDSLKVGKDRKEWRIYFGYRSGDVMPALRHYYAQGQKGEIGLAEAVGSVSQMFTKGLEGNEVKFMTEVSRDAELRMAFCRYLERMSYRYLDWDEDKNEVDPAVKMTIERWKGVLLGMKGEELTAEAGVMAAVCYRNDWGKEVDGWLKVMKSDTEDSLFLRGKLAVKRGRYDEAATSYEKLVKLVDPKVEGLGEFYYGDLRYESRRDRVYQAYGEYGAVDLARRQWAGALRNFLLAGDFQDAAYVAEGVMSVDELLGFVRKHFAAEIKPEVKVADASRARDWLRGLLGRRLARENRFVEAKEFLPEQVLDDVDRYAALYAVSEVKGLADDRRAKVLWELAEMRVDLGRQLFWLQNGCRPDSRVSAAGLRGDPRYEDEESNYRRVLRVSDDEKKRFRKNFRPISRARVHFYDAAKIAKRAALLLPKDDENAAVILWRAGSWLKDGDPKAADEYYQLLVRRCGGTELGKVADEKRWFPVGDWRVAW